MQGNGLRIHMIRLSSIIAAALLLTISSAAAANQKYAGQWDMTSMKLTVSVESWGENCGPKPKGYASSKVRPVEIVSSGKHLVFTKGGLRTDRCISPNPYLQTVQKSFTDTTWHRICETPASDSKFERISYTLTATDNNHLEYLAKTKYDWTLKGDNCVAYTTEKRKYARNTSGEETPAEPVKTAEPPEPAGGGEEPSDEVETSDCERDGPIKKLIVTPRDARIGPGEKVCFKAVGVDAVGCRFKVAATWSVSQGGQEVGGLMTRNGCFKSGATAADSEGDYDVVARAEGKEAVVLVTVAFPDLGELLRARLHPGENADSAQEVPAEAGEKPSSVAPFVPMPASAAPQESSNTTLLVIIIGSAVFLAAFLLVLVLVLRRRKSADDPFEEDDWSDDEEGYADQGDSHAEASSGDSGELVCPKCGEVFPPTAKFCPHDAAPLAPVGRKAPEHKPGMVCPKCHRGYDPDAKFCPHDSEKLMPYPEWRKSRRS